MAVANLLSLKSITIVHGRNPDIIWKVIEDENSSGFFEQLIIDQGIDQIIPSGTLIVRDTGDILSHFNFSGRDPLTIEVEVLDPTTGEPTLKTFYFIIYQATHATDYADRNSTKLITLKFIDDLYFYNSRRNFDASINNENIFSNLTFYNRISKINTFITTLIDSIINKTDTNYIKNIDPTYNYYYNVENPEIFPSGIRGDKNDFLTTFNYITSNAVNTTKLVPDFFCWFNTDLEFNFISYDTMVGASAGYAILNTGNIDAIDNAIPGFKINSITPICNFSLMELENNGAFCSYYNRVEPNLENPYFGISDFISGVTIFPVVYQLGMTLRGGGQLFNLTSANFGETGDVLKFSGQWRLSIEVDNFNPIYKENNRSYSAWDPSFTTKKYEDDQKWGFFDKGFYNKSDEPSYTFHGGFKNSILYRNENKPIGFNDLYHSNNRFSAIKWQNMFDIEEMNPIVGITYTIQSSEPGAPPGTCYEQVNFVQKVIDITTYLADPYPFDLISEAWPGSLEEDLYPWSYYLIFNPFTPVPERVGRSEYYFRLRELKERWNMFKYVVCCMNNSNDSFYALIVGATGVEENSGTVVIDPIPEKSKAFKYAWKEIEFIPKAYEGLSGTTQTIQLYPQFGGSGSAGCTFGIPVGISGMAGITGITFAYSHPFFEILIPNDSRSGGFTGQTFGFTGFYPAPTGTTFVKIPVSPYFPALNINEFTNFELNQTGLKRKYAGPGVNMEIDAFPLGNKIIPVGYMPSEDDPCIHQLHGQIVKMYQIPTKDISGISLSDNDLKAMPLIYVFDVQNSIEGQCTECDEG